MKKKSSQRKQRLQYRIRSYSNSQTIVSDTVDDCLQYHVQRFDDLRKKYEKQLLQQFIKLIRTNFRSRTGTNSQFFRIFARC